MLTCRFYFADFQDYRPQNSRDWLHQWINQYAPEQSEAQDAPLIGFSFDGHADSAPHGEDIVCAAVSALAAMAMLSATEIIALDYETKLDTASGQLRPKKSSSLTGVQLEQVSLILESTFLAIHQINQSYDEKYIHLEIQKWIEEVKNDEN